MTDLSNNSGRWEIPGKNWSIETADWRDFPRLKHLEAVCFRKEDLWPLFSLIGVLVFPGIVHLKAVKHEIMVAFIAGERKDSMGWITTLCVHPDHRHDGIASALLDACEEMMGKPTVRLSVRASNKAAIALYRKTGYSVVDCWKRYYTGGEDGLVLEKRI